MDASGRYFIIVHNILHDDKIDDENNDFKAIIDLPLMTDSLQF